MEKITQIGSHRVQHGNLMNGIGELMCGEKAAIFYSDPPWGQGNLNYWQTINWKMTGAPKIEIDLKAFLCKIFELAVEYSEGMIFIEYGVRWKDEVINTGREYGLRHLSVIQIKYRAGSSVYPMHIHIFNKVVPCLSPLYLNEIEGTMGMETLRKAVGPFAEPGKIILDPACGLGNTARIAMETGMHFRGNEINEARLLRTVDLIKKKITVK